jgi:nickel/cobalt transporter (NicO) family protein
VNQRRTWTWIAVTAAALIGGVFAGPTAAAAHPLGNFSVNHYHGLRLDSTGLDDLAIIDEAEIPTMQRQSIVDSDSDGTVSDGERAAYADRTCGELAAALSFIVDGRPVAASVAGASFAYYPGAANLRTGRTECRLRVAAAMPAGTHLRFADGYLPDRVGWHEITATGDGVGILDSPVPQGSVSDELRRYPTNLLSSPLDQRSVELVVAAGSAGAGAEPALPVGGPVGRLLGALTDRFYGLAAAPGFGPAVGLLAVGLALLLGAMPAALPGHGKTVMAAYIAGRRGTIRDALMVGATVTGTHTAGVLVVGLLLTFVAGLVGELVLGWLGVVSGLIIAAVGVSLLRAAARASRDRRSAVLAPDAEQADALATVPAGQHDGGAAGLDHRHPEGGDHHQPVGDDHHHGQHHHGHHHHDWPGHRHPPMPRRGLVGMGIAGGLVPSPTALVVLLGAVALGRTWFGVLLVLAYGIGMAAALTAAGLVLVHLGRRLDRVASRSAASSVSRAARRIAVHAPMWTAVLVLAVGLGLAVRAAQPLLS